MHLGGFVRESQSRLPLICGLEIDNLVTRVLQVTLMTPCNTIIAILLQVVLVTFAALYCTVSTTLFWIFHVTFAASCTTSLGLSYSCHGFVLHCQHGSSLDLLDNPPSFCQSCSDLLPHSTTPRILRMFTVVLSSHVHTC